MERDQGALKNKPVESTTLEPKVDGRIPGVDTLRGLAALAVCWFHITQDSKFLSSVGVYGAMGVEVFFVISGFIIPFALQRAQYKLKDYPKFLLKRILRLDPPYLASIVLVLTVGYLLTFSPHYSGEEFKVDWLGLFLHLGYLNVVFHHPWINPVYWTLAIEFQYYLLVGLMFPLIGSKRRVLRLLAFVVLGGSAVVVRNGTYIFFFIFLFLMGMTVFQYKNLIIPKWEFLALIAIATAGSLLTLSVPVTVAGLIGVGGILFLNIRHSVFMFLGTISYSLYLVHPPAIKIVLTIGRRFMLSRTSELLLDLVALGFSVAAAYVLYLLVERPAQRWSSAIRYKRISKVSTSDDKATEILSFDAGM